MNRQQKEKAALKWGSAVKQPDVAALQDLLIYALKGLSLYAVEGRKVGVNDHEVNLFTCEAIFSTLTNVDFDPERFVALIGRCVELRDQLKEKVSAAGGKVDCSEAAADFKPEATLEGLVKQGEKVGVKSDPEINPDILSLQQTLIYGIKGVAAYADHAQILGQEDDAVYAFIHEGLAATLKNDLSLDDWVGLVLSVEKSISKPWNYSMQVIQVPMATRCQLMFPSGLKKGKPFWYPVMI